MPLLPLPAGGARLDSGDLLVVTEDDVALALPSFVRAGDDAPVRDGLVAALFAILSTFQGLAGDAAALSDVLRATGGYLDEIGREREIFRAAGELDPAYRARILTAPGLVTPEAVLAAANAILAPYTAIQARYCESLGDRLFLRRASVAGGPRAFLYRRASLPRSPDYPDRRYVSEAAQNGGVSAPGREPGAARLFRDRLGRMFLLRVPDLSSLGGADAPAYAEPLDGGFFVGAGAPTSVTTYVRTNAQAPLTLYAAICNVVNRIKGHSIRWVLLVDPNLVS
jgi:hypothetical protein